MARLSSFELYDAVYGGGLADRIRAMRAEEVSYDDIAITLRVEGLRVSRATVQRWSVALGLDARHPGHVQ